MAEASQVMDELKEVFGGTCLLETLRDEMFKAIELNCDTPAYTQDAPSSCPGCLALKLCCDTLVNMLLTGRYHVGKGILSSEGEELVAMFNRICALRAQKACITPQEAEEEAEFLEHCARASG
jgi:hypothetical protein